MQKDNPLKSIWKPGVCSPSLDFQKKGEVWQNWIDHVMLLSGAYLEGIVPCPSLWGASNA